MEWYVYILITLAGVVGMEFMAWFTHKYVMHGILWSWHKVHHQPQIKGPGFFEKNDLFFLVYAIPSAILYIVGTLTIHKWALFLGIGISLYGIIYFIIHDVYIHRRFNWFKPSKSTYSQAILRAHGTHHAIQTKHGAESFGLLVVAPKFFKARKRRKNQ